MTFTIPLWQVDAFARRPFQGNPAAVCLLERPLPVATMQAIAAENNLPETAFIRRVDGAWSIRWFTPGVEVDLCGHATLASAWVVLNEIEKGGASVTFDSVSGPLGVARQGSRLVLDFPTRFPAAQAAPDALVSALGAAPGASYTSIRDWLLVYPSEADVAALAPDFPALAHAAPMGGVIATAPGDEADFVSRFFAPAVGVNEDPVTGSAHCVLVPYWAKRLGRSTLVARQVSARGGVLFCEDRGARVGIGGHAVPFLAGSIFLPADEDDHHGR